MKERLLELFKKRYYTDSKSESYKCEKEICKILQSVVDKLKNIEDEVGYYANVPYYYVIHSIENNYCYKELPPHIYCNQDSVSAFEFDTDWLDIEPEEYFNDLKQRAISSKKTTIENVEKSLNKHKEELENLRKLKYES